MNIDKNTSPESVEVMLRQSRESELLRFTTAGSVDDGKSTLIGRMLHDSKSIYSDHLDAVHRDSKKLGREEIDYALLTDGLKAEREQGITIDVAFRYFSTPKRRFIIADTPGHEQYTRNMATGASTADLAVVLIDARYGILTQSRRHCFISSLLRIPHVVVAVNKMDLVDWSEDVYEKIKADFIDFARKLNINDLSFIPISALKGDNVVNKSNNMPWYDGAPLLSFLENVYIDSGRNLIDFRFPVQYVNRPNHEFRGYCGTVASGVVRKGDKITVHPSRKETRIESIVTMDGEIPEAFSGMSVTLTLEDEIDISRGNMLTHVNNLPDTGQDLEAMLVWMNEEKMSLDRHYLIKHCTQTVRATIADLMYKIDPNTLHRQDSDGLELNEIGRVKISMLKSIAYDEYSKNRNTGNFIVIDTISNTTVAAGMIIRRSSGHRSAALDSTPKSQNISWHESMVTQNQRMELLGQKPVTLWFTGLSASGKSTIGFALENELMNLGRACYVLDGDNIRHGINRDLGFSPGDRKENIRRIAEIAKLMNDAGLIVITAFISPYREDRDAARKIIGNDNFIEVYVDTPIDECRKRDPKGLYKKADSGEIPDFTGVNSPYEHPLKPELHVRTDKQDVEEIQQQILAMLHLNK
jgi:bifunctional enzyme CysN/CysC